MTTDKPQHTRRAATVGMFDGVHLGHQQVIRQLCEAAMPLGLKPTVFTFNRHPMSLISPDRQPKALSTNAQKADLLIGYGADEVVFLAFDDEMRTLSAERFLLMLHSKYDVDLLVLGFNHHFGHCRKGTFGDYREIGAQMGIELVSADEYVNNDFCHPVSSSTIRHLISEGDMSTANQMLGRPYTLRGHVVHGRHIGSGIGFPTANVAPCLSTQLIPMQGVYAAIADVAGKGSYLAMVNIGTNPSIVADTHPLTIEAHIIDFDSDIYNQLIDIRFIRRLRDEKKFDGIDALQAQLVADRLAIMKDFGDC